MLQYMYFIIIYLYIYNYNTPQVMPYHNPRGEGGGKAIGWGAKTIIMRTDCLTFCISIVMSVYMSDHADY